MSDPQDDSLNLKDVKQLGLMAAVTSLGYVFWVVGGMEMIERLSYYGVKAVAALYAKDPVSKGGLGISMSEFGDILLVWALFQSLIPVFSGALSDRYGYKETIFASTIVKIIGYLIMGFFPSFSGFLAGAIVLATGTAIFKPGIQGTLVKCTSEDTRSMAWGIFYQTVNIGGFLGPILAGTMRKMAWENVFFACAAIISINFLMLLIYKEPGKAERLAAKKALEESGEAGPSLLADSLHELKRPVLWVYLAIFSGFWFMFNALFDVLPVHIDEWVDSSDIVNFFTGGVAASGEWWTYVLVTNEAGTAILPESLLNLNAGLIMTVCFFFAWLSGLMRATTSMVIGTLLATVSFFLLGPATSGWFMGGTILIFSVGEMLSSPKFSEFVGNIAPADKKAMYLGFSQIPLAVGWTLEGKLGPMFYDMFASKERFSRELLLERGMADDAVSTIPVGEAFTTLVEFTGESAKSLTTLLHSTHDIYIVWWIMGVVGILSAIGIWIYGKWILTLRTAEAE